jgi:hypothetical protein
MHEQITQLKRYAIMTGTVIAIAVLLIASTRPNQTMDRTELVGFAITCGLATGGPIWIIAWLVEISRGRK